jgi:predicted DNA repair protein MutK
MASGFFALFDDIAVLLDDVAAMSKIATKKTAGILGDDLAVNAEKASGFTSTRELPILWSITKGSFLNKLIILPIAFLLSAFLPSTIIPILLIGGIYLAFEGAEKIYEYIFPHQHSEHVSEDLVEMTEEEIIIYEKKRIKSAIIVDFILSLEIIIIALSTVVEKSLSIQIIVVTIVAIIATAGVYGIVALIIRMDDFGYRLIKLNSNNKSVLNRIGQFLVNALPIIIRGLAFIGTIAMLLVAGGIYVHNINYIHKLVHSIPSIIGEFIVGLIVGFVALFIVKSFKRLSNK